MSRHTAVCVCVRLQNCGPATVPRTCWGVLRGGFVVAVLVSGVPGPRGVLVLHAGRYGARGRRGHRGGCLGRLGCFGRRGMSWSSRGGSSWYLWCVVLHCYWHNLIQDNDYL